MSSKNNWRLVVERGGETVIRSSSLTERLVLAILVLALVSSGLSIAWRMNNSFLVGVPEEGGILREGIIGIPRFINPVLSASEADKDMTALIYSGLLKATPENELVLDAASDFSISPDGRTYTFKIKENLVFHDGSLLTADDVEFTVLKIQDPSTKSPRRGAWEGVGVEKVNSHEIRFTLKQAHSPFAENLTVGILPKQIWKDVPTDQFSFSQLNVDPVGSGPYKVKSIKRNSIGLPLFYELDAFPKYALGRPFISKLITYFYQNEKELLSAYKDGRIESLNGISPRSATEIKKKESEMAVSVLPRIFGVFFNQNQAAIFVNKEVRQALSLALERERIVDTVLGGYGRVVSGPTLGMAEDTASESATSTEEMSAADAALALLTKSGWGPNPETGIMEKRASRTSTTTLSFSLETSDTAELKQAAEIIKESWQKIGASVDVKIFETSDLNQNIIRPRKFDALFFGTVIGRTSDLYPFWHSSQRNDPGVNVALYANIKTDKLLEEIRATSSAIVRSEKLRQFEEIVKEDAPAAFAYAPEFIYIVPKKLRGVRLGQITNSGERFLNIHEWFINTNKVWEIFAK